MLRYPRGRAIRLARAGKLPCIVLPDGEMRFRRSDLERIVAVETDESSTGGANDE
jgi:predicted site-specific integrase-resolvase